ncbi:LuxR C-terminal-related transcriptional regulator [Solirubrobacter deserti]|uniref:LuxR C-terminal-related transcriptional regulator n=1 Tax=Solirubrobacter deserti TaxID=2282478 RepID=A0ABT4RE71_9ACTN|nr:LuxR C-terminal-related transcriptional regulator [Solirubrobacter deserti]MDA0136820.1 LuxR C-terminal-related transcriptional regulator [Solirubrobacter deserti]
MVERDRLRLHFAEPVTLVCAPAGSGKTAFTAAEVQRSPLTTAWVTLEPTDDEPGPFWDAVLTALDLAGAVPADSPLAALAAPIRESRDRFMPLLVNALATLPEPVVLVLDDVHVLRSRECLSQLSFLLLHAPDTLRLVLTARSDPALPLHVLRVRGRLAEVRATDLAFTENEAGELLAAHGLTLDAELVRALHQRTEGWGAGLRLAALSLQGREDPDRFVAEFAGDDRVIADYLVAEVLDRQPPRLRAFLLRTALVERVCGGLADALTGERNGADTLATLERTNGFVLGVDGHREWFRYHRLFAKLLRTRAERELAGELPALHARAARWYAERGAAVDALEHAVQAQEWDLAVEVVAGHWFELYVRGDAAAVRALASKLPPDRLERDAELAAALACAALDVGDTDAAEFHLAHAHSAPPPEARRRRYLETLALANLGTARLKGDFEAALQAADALLAEAATHAGEDGTREALVRAMLGETALWAHDLERAGEELRKAVALARAHRLDFVAVSALSYLALLDVMVHGPAEEEGHGPEAIELAARRGWSDIPQTACAHTALALIAFYDLQPCEAARHLEHARVAAARLRRRQLDFVIAHLDARMRGAAGVPREGLRTLEDFEALHRHRGAALPHEQVSIAAMRARLQIQAGDLDGATATLAPVREEPWVVVGTATARLALARGESADAVEALERSIDAAATHAVSRVEAGALLAVAHDEAAEPQKAQRALEHALALAERTRHRWPFIELGRRMEDLLKRQIRAGTAHRAIVGELLDTFADRAPVARHVAPLLEPLSEREQAILRYLPTALSNREIAAELFVTTNTVKTHLRSIYRKLDVARRREAVERARDLRLLSSRR